MIAGCTDSKAQSPFLISLLAVLMLLPAATYAFSEGEVIQNGDSFGYDGYQGGEPLQVTGDAIPWDVFGRTGQNEQCTTDTEGFENCSTTPDYSEEILQLDGRNVTLMGFMFPLEAAEGQRNFLFGPYPLSCPFHYHTRPAQVVEVQAVTPVTFSYDPITIKGVLSVKFNAETGVFYTLDVE